MFLFHFFKAISANLMITFEEADEQTIVEANLTRCVGTSITEPHHCKRNKKNNHLLGVLARAADERACIFMSFGVVCGTIHKRKEREREKELTS